ncbi:hypothetical protein ACR3K2_16980 [Cryptosporidium serpentis]
MDEKLIVTILKSLELKDWANILFTIVVFIFIVYILLRWLQNNQSRLDEIQKVMVSSQPVMTSNSLVFDKAKAKEIRLKNMMIKQRINAKKARESRRELLRNKEMLRNIKEELHKKKKDEKLIEELKRREILLRNKQQEYEKWKKRIVIEDSGQNTEDEDLNSELLSLSNFINLIKTKKVIQLDDLSSNFNISIDDTINRIQELEKQNLLDGVFTDSGKYIYITETEWQDLTKALESKGIIEKSSSLVSICNQVINIDKYTTQNMDK